MTRENRVISLLTDFGLEDEYVGVMKAVLLNHCSNTQIIDISHSVPPQNIQHAARLLQHSYSYFPEGTVHLVVVDPGVGSNRDIIIIQSLSHIFIAPDNGVLTPILQSDEFQSCYRLKKECYVNTDSATFHGRDIMAPIAGKIAAGSPADEFSEKILPSACTTIDFPVVKKIGKTLSAEITAIDHFGNITTTLKPEDLSSLQGTIVFVIGSTTISGLHRTYADVPEGQLLALIDSKGYVEISKNRGNAAKSIGCATGDQVSVKSQ